MSGLVGREAERERLEDVVARARGGDGALVLVAGEAGVGKTRLVEAAAADSDALVLRGASSHGATVPYGPLIAAFRSHLRSAPDALSQCGPLQGHLAVLLPELGPRAKTSDRATLLEAVRCALAHLAAQQHLLLVLDDLHWSDAATLALLSGLADSVDGLPVAIFGTYRSDGLPRDHGVRRLRNELRRSGRLDEIVLEPLERDQIAELLTAVLGARPARSLVAAVHDRTAGVPFFAEELARALVAAKAVQPGRHGLELAGRDEVPLPDTIRDAVMLGAHELSDDARAAADAAAVAGDVFDLDLVAGIAGDVALDELLANGLVVDEGQGRARFRHALSREAVYADIPWLRRRALHRQVAEALEAAHAPATLVATHWVGASDGPKARQSLLAAAAESEAVHAYSDAAQYGRQALELWPEPADEGHDPERTEALERYARCSELSGDIAEAVRAWRELSDIRGSLGQGVLLAQAQRRLAAAYDLKGEGDSAFAARRVAAEAFAENDMAAEAALDHLSMANQLRTTAKHVAAVEIARTAVAEAEQANRLDLRLRARGIEGMALAKGGEYEAGLAIVREALATALEHELTPVAAELYQRLSVVLYDAADYHQAAEALDTALELCQMDGGGGIEEACISCIAYVLRELGEWQEAGTICRDLAASGKSLFVADGLLGSIHAYQGRFSSARRMLTASLATSSRLGHYNMTVDSTTALAFVAAAEGAHDEAAEHCRAITARWAVSDDHHYATSGLRWSAAYFARQGERQDAHVCADALTQIASASGQAEALSALAHALAELSLLDGDADTAAEQLTNALDLQRTIDMPFVRAQIELRAGVALAAAGETEAGLERLSTAYRTARKLGARPLAAEAAREAAALGDSVVRRLGRGAEADAEEGGLSRREREVVRLLAVGRTNREIAQELFLSPRTVDMHVRNILRKLDCRSRVEAANRASELGLVA
jgi:predicted ATPase/DNA-binding NarL/FixJ family response regulator